MEGSADQGEAEVTLTAEREATLWDEFKYRHDLVWKHLIQSTIAVFTLTTLPLSSAFDTVTFKWAGPLIGLLYVGFAVWVLTLRAELKLFSSVDRRHCEVQRRLFNISEPCGDVTRPFRSRCWAYIAGLGLVAVAGLAYQLAPLCSCQAAASAASTVEGSVAP